MNIDAGRPPHNADAVRDEPAATSAVADAAVLDRSAYAAFLATTHPTFDTPDRIVRTGDLAQLKRVVADAARRGETIAAVSCGQNIGLGGRLGPFAGSVLIEMSAHRCIVGFDERFGVVDVEPGVTFAQLHGFLRERRSAWFLPAIGGPPEASVVGNFLQSGDGTGPGGVREPNLLGIEAILPNGDIVSTGNELDRPGPNITGLFARSDFGIVTRARIALTLLPRCLQGFVFRNRRPGPPLAALAALEAAYQHGILAPGSTALWNGIKHVLSGKSTVPDPDIWYISGATHAASLARLGADWQDLLDCFKQSGEVPELISHQIDRNPGGSGLLQGEPTTMNLGSVRSGISNPSNSDASAAGFAWICPVVPFDSARVSVALGIIRDALDRAAIPSNLALSCRDARTIRGFVALAWDRSVPGRDAQAVACHDELLEALCSSGFPPYRLGHLSRAWRRASTDDTAAFIARLKAACGKPND